MTHLELLDKCFKTIDTMLDNIVNGINVNKNIIRYNYLTNSIQRYIQFNLILGSVTNKEIEFNPPMYLRNLYNDLYKNAEISIKMYKPNLRWSVKENVDSYFKYDKPHYLSKYMKL